MNIFALWAIFVASSFADTGSKPSNVTPSCNPAPHVSGHDSTPRESLERRYLSLKEAISLYAGDVDFEKRRGTRGKILSDVKKLSDAQIEKELDVISARRGPCDISSEEALAIFDFSQRTFIQINGAIRKGCKDCFPELVESIDNGLEKLAPYGGLVIRYSDLPTSVEAEHQVGKTVCYDAYTSTSADPNWEWDGKYRFLIQSLSGRMITALTRIPDEKEVLFPRGSCFKITDRKERADGKVEIKMTEIPQKHVSAGVEPVAEKNDILDSSDSATSAE